MYHLRQYERLAEEKRSSRRTIADAIEVLREAADFQEYDRAKIEIGILQLSSGDTVGLVQIVFDSAFQENVFVVSLPTSAQFQGKRPGSSRRERIEISRLNGAVVDAAANVLLTEGVSLRAVEVVPANLPLAPSELDWRIVRYAISIAGEEECCYRHLADGLEPPFRDMVPNIKALDCATFSGLDVPPLKVIASHIAARDWTLKKLSQQKIADTLRKFGIRVPATRPRHKARHDMAVI